MFATKLICLLGLIRLGLNTNVVSSQVIDAAGQVTASDISTKLALMEKVINSLVQRSQEAENKLHTVETQLTDVKARDEKLIQGLNTQIKAFQEQQIISETNLKAQIKAVQDKDAILANKMQQASEQIQNLQQDKTSLEVKLQVLESHLQQQTGAWKEIKESEATLKAHQSILTARQDNQVTILKGIENKQTGILSKQSSFEGQLKNQEIKLMNHDNNQIVFTNKQAEITRQQILLVEEVANQTQTLAIVQLELQNVSKKQTAMENDFKTRFNVMEKHTGDSDFRLMKFEDTQANVTNTNEIHIATANKKFSEISSKQIHLEQKYSTIQAIQSLGDKNIQNLELKQQVLDHQIANQTAQIKNLGTARATANVQQVAWTSSDGTDSGIIKTLNFIKKNTYSGLDLSFYGTIRLYGSISCNRWWFELNGSECTNPAKIDAMMYTRTAENHHLPGAVSGICYGVPAGNVTIVFRVGSCNNGYALGDANTGWTSASRIIVEEI